MHIYNKFIGDSYNEKTSTYSDDIIFMNHGYVDVCEYGYPLHEFSHLKLNKYNQNYKLQANLYHKLISAGNIFTGTYLDLACGRGGGINFILDNFNFSKIYGVDVSTRSIDFCKSWIPQAEFKLGSATEIPLLDNSIDVISSVEASHEFMPYELFIEECGRVLKPGGKYVQVGYLYNYDAILNFNNSNFTLDSFVDISYNTLLACSITKWNYYYNILNKEMFEVFEAEEKFYLNKLNKYYLMVLTKK